MERKIEEKKSKLFLKFLDLNLEVPFYYLQLYQCLITAVFLVMSSTKTVDGYARNVNIQLLNSLEQNVNLLVDSTDAVMETLSKTDVITSMETELMDSLLQETVKAYPTITQIYIMEPQGMQIYKTSGKLGDRADRDYFQKAIKGEANFSDVIISGSTNRPIIVIAKPLEKNGRIVGVIGASIDLDYLSVIATQSKNGETGRAYIVERNGQIIGHEDPTLVEGMVDVSDREAVSGAINMEHGQLEYDIDKVEYLAAISGIEKTGWGLIVEITTKEAFKAISAQRRVFLILLVINVLITTVVALRIAKRTVNPIERLTNKMDEAAKGNLTVGFHGNILTSKNEFGLMARSFNKMLEELKLVVDGMMTSAKNLETSASDLDSVVKDNKEAINQIVEGTASLAETATQDSQDVNMSYQAVGIVAEGADNVAGHILDLMVCYKTV